MEQGVVKAEIRSPAASLHCRPCCLLSLLPLQQPIIWTCPRRLLAFLVMRSFPLPPVYNAQLEVALTAAASSSCWLALLPLRCAS